MMTRVLRLILLVAVAAEVSSAKVRADPVPLTGGFLDFAVTLDGCCGAVQLTGDRGFFFETSPNAWYHFAPMGADEPLPPGATISLLGAGSGGAFSDDLAGVLRFDGMSFEYQEDGGGWPGGWTLWFKAMVPMPAVLSARAVVTAPFTLEFEFPGWHLPDGTVISEAFVGSGLATFDLEGNPHEFGVPSWRIAHMRGELSSAPVPEPSTLWLIGSAGAVGAFRRRRRKTHEPL